jgi:hypothetical protein
MVKTSEINEAAEKDQEILIVDETGYDISWFLCTCPTKEWVE